MRLHTAGILSLDERNAISAVANSTNYGLTNIHTLHSYVHSIHAPINTPDVRAHWDVLDRFLRSVLTNMPT